MVLDGPTVGLDPILHRDLWNLFDLLASGGVSLLISSHVMDEASHCARILLLDEGRLLADLTPAQWLESTGTADADAGSWHRSGRIRGPFSVTFLVTSITTLRERRSGTLERLMTLPLAKFDFIAGYTQAFSLLGTVPSLIAARRVGLSARRGREHWVLLAVAALDLVLDATLGLFVSTFAASEFQVIQFMPALVLPQALLGGIFIPRSQMPPDRLRILPA